MADFEHQEDDLLISDRQALLDIAMVHDFLANRSYWARGIPRELVERSPRNSLCFGAYRNGRQIAFARVITDRATFGWLADVFVLEEDRGLGTGQKMMAVIVRHPDLIGLRRFMFITKDAQGFYQRFGFQTETQAERFMSIHRENPYLQPQSGF